MIELMRRYPLAAAYGALVLWTTIVVFILSEVR